MSSIRTLCLVFMAMFAALKADRLTWTDVSSARIHLTAFLIGDQEIAMEIIPAEIITVHYDENGIGQSVSGTLVEGDISLPAHRCRIHLPVVGPTILCYKLPH